MALCAQTTLAYDLGPGQWDLGIYGGAYMPDLEELDNGYTGGLRLGYQPSEHILLSSSLGYTNLDGNTGKGASRIRGNFDAWLLDFNVWYIFRPESRLSLLVGAGPGWAFVDSSLKNSLGVSLDPGGEGDDTFTANLAFGPLFKLNDHVNIRLMSRLRYFEQRNNDKVDREFTLGLEIPLGGRKVAAPVVAAAPPAPVVPTKCADSDSDGVCDTSDQCPDTPRGAKVEANGCPVVVQKPVSFDLTVEFAFNSAEINDLSFRELRRAMQFLRDYPNTAAVIEGNTDSVGGEEYNQRLSVRRAQAVVDVLTKSGIEGSRLTAVGNGETKPIASNATDEGRAKNRRVSIVVSGTGVVK